MDGKAIKNTTTNEWVFDNIPDWQLAKMELDTARFSAKNPEDLEFLAALRQERIRRLRSAPPAPSTGEAKQP